DTSTTGRSAPSPGSSRTTGAWRDSKACFRGRWPWPAFGRRSFLARLHPVDLEGLSRAEAPEIPIGIHRGDAPIEATTCLSKCLEVRGKHGPFSLVGLDPLGEVRTRRDLDDVLIEASPSLPAQNQGVRGN